VDPKITFIGLLRGSHVIDEWWPAATNASNPLRLDLAMNKHHTVHFAHVLLSQITRQTLLENSLLHKCSQLEIVWQQRT
jgi:hypothetical protein